MRRLTSSTSANRSARRTLSRARYVRSTRHGGRGRLVGAIGRAGVHVDPARLGGGISSWLAAQRHRSADQLLPPFDSIDCMAREKATITLDRDKAAEAKALVGAESTSAVV